MNFVMQTVQGHAKRPREILPLVRTFCFDHFTVENQIDTSIKITAIRRQTICRVPYSKRALLEEHDLRSKCF